MVLVIQDLQIDKWEEGVDSSLSKAYSCVSNYCDPDWNWNTAQPLSITSPILHRLQHMVFPSTRLGTNQTSVNLGDMAVNKI